MKKFANLLAILCVIVAITASSFAFPVSAATKITTTPTGYTSADDVDYLIKGGTVVNWGARGEDCVFLSKYATAFYTGTNTYDNFITKAGETPQSNAPQSALYSTLKSFMKSKHSYETSYGATKDYYKYTDCVSNDYAKLSSFYSGTLVNSTWDKGNTYNREHTWPNSKGLDGNDENDIMMLRPTIPSENGSRGNKAYGESSGYFNPGESVRGDVARIFLYVYVRWGNTSYAWGTAGVMENKNVLLKWMEEDPVDTWEMGRNDAVQSITGTRNVFIDYPELAWKLFGREIPSDMTTPSGKASNSSGGGSTDDPVHTHSYGAWTVVTEATHTAAGQERRTCSGCGDVQTREIPALSDEHNFGEWTVVTEATNTEDGLEMRVCEGCGAAETRAIPSIDSTHNYSDWITVKEATNTEDGLEQRTCKDCGETQTRAIPSIDSTHNYSGWITVKEATNTQNGLEQRTCKDCGETQTREIPAIGGGESGWASDVVPPVQDPSNCKGAMGAPLMGMLVLALSTSFILKKKIK